MRSLQTTQLLALSNQLRDAQGTANDLRNQLLQADRSRNDAERRADRAELELQMERMRATPNITMRSPGYHNHFHRDRHGHRGHEHRVRRRITRYRGGGESTTFVTPSDEEEEALHQPWLDDEILSREYIDTTPNRRHTSTDHHCTPHTIQQHSSPYRLAIPDCTEAHLAIMEATSSRAHRAATDNQVGINLTPSRARGHNVSISVTPHREASEPYSGWEDTPRSSGARHD
jgi:hypothetical protein